MANPFPNKKIFVDLKTVFFFKSLNHFQQFENYVSKVQTVNIRQYLEHPHIFVKTNQKHIHCGDHIPSTHTCISLAP